MTGAADQALIAVSVAALRRNGWPAGRAVALIAGQLPAGNARTSLEQVSASLARVNTWSESASPTR